MKTRRPFCLQILIISILILAYLSLTIFLVLIDPRKVQNPLEFKNSALKMVIPRSTLKTNRMDVMEKGKSVLAELNVTCFGLCSTENGTSQVDYVSMMVKHRLANYTRLRPRIDDIVQERKHQTWSIRKVTFSELGTQPKLILDLKMNNGEYRTAIFKPKLYNRNWTFHISCTGYDRDNGELGAYYFAQTMGNFVQVTETLGVRLDMKRDLWPIRQGKFKELSWINNGSYCIKFVCKYCYNRVVCGEGESKPILEGSLSFWSPKKLEKIENPWSGTCTHKKKEEWRYDQGLCLKIKSRNPFYSDTKTLLDVIDAGVFDFLIDNPDRHHFEYWEKKIGKNGEIERSIILLDNGKAFSHPDREDDLGILAALFQCCMIRKSTYKILKQFQKTSSLADRFNWVMSFDSVYPFLPKRHVSRAVQRRLIKTIQVVEMCIEKYGESDVVIKL